VGLPPLPREHGVQVLLHRHLFAEAAVVVCEDGVRVALHRLLHQLVTGGGESMRATRRVWGVWGSEGSGGPGV